MSSLEKLTGCSTCATSFNQTATPAMMKPAIPLNDICPCYRPKLAMG